MNRNISAKNAEYVAWIAMIVSFLFGCLTFIVAHWNHSQATYLEGWHYMGGILIWLLVLLHTRQIRLAAEEKQGEPLSSSDTSLFQGSEADIFSAQHRLQVFEKWIIPIATGVTATIFLGLGIWLLVGLFREDTPALVENAPISAAFLTGFAFFCLLLSKYALGMAQQKLWRLLQAGASYMFVNACTSFLCAVVVTLTHMGLDKPDYYFAAVIPFIMVLIGLEMLLNLLLEIYRPRVIDEEIHPAYDSRLLELCTGSRGFLRTIAQTLDYQFGFKISETWFYQFLEKAIVPLILFMLLILELLTCIVIVEVSQQGLVERFGYPARQVSPGLHVKWPWPIEKIYYFPVQTVQILTFGFEEHQNSKTLIYTQADHHHQNEDLFLLAHRTESHRQDKLTAKDHPLAVRAEDFKDLLSLTTKLQSAQDPLSKYLRDHFAEDTRELLQHYAESPQKLQLALMQDLNRMLVDVSLYHPDRFSHISLDEETQKLIVQTDPENDVVHLNRLLLEQAYPNEFVSGKELQRNIVPVNLLAINVVLNYRIKKENLLDYMRHKEPQLLLEGIGNRELTQYFASLSMDDVLGAGRLNTYPALQEFIQKRCDELKLGIDITFLGVCVAHPPDKTADAFEEVLQAEEEMKTSILQAQTGRQQTLPKAKAEAQVIQMNAESKSYKLKALAAADAKAFENFQKAYELGKSIYLYQKYLKSLEQQIPGKRCYLLCIPGIDKETTVINLEDSFSANFGQLDLSPEKGAD